MDRLEDIKHRYTCHYVGIFDAQKVDDDIQFLLSENERLKKEKEWLLHKYALTQSTSIWHTTTSDEDVIIEEMQQALKEE